MNYIGYQSRLMKIIMRSLLFIDVFLIYSLTYMNIPDY